MTVTRLPVPVRVTLEVPADMPILDLLNGLAARGYHASQHRGVLRVTRPQRRHHVHHNTPPPRAA